MWIFTTSGFVSVVADTERPGNLLVRGRFRGDLERMFPGNRVRRTPKRDYPYRISVSREVVGNFLWNEAVTQVIYPNFKDAVPKKRASIYTRVWAMMASAGDVLRRRPKITSWEDEVYY